VECLFSIPPHTDARRRRRRFNVGGVLVVNTPPASTEHRAAAACAAVAGPLVSCNQGLALPHFSAQREQPLWDRMGSFCFSVTTK
jgi:hypothetical protein